MKRAILLAAVLFLIPMTAAGTPQLSLDTGNGQACPTGSGQYTIELYNPGPAEDRYQVAVDAPWTDVATLPDDTVRVGVGETERIPLWIQAPKTAAPGDHRFTVSATSSNNGKTVKEPAEMTVFSCRQVSIDPVQEEQTVCRGDEAVYRMNIENEGRVEETYRLSADAGHLSADRVTLGPDETTEVTLTLSSREAGSQTVQVRAESTSSYSSDTAELGFTSEQCRSVDVTAAPGQASLCQSDTLLLTASVSNTGSVADTYRVGIGDWTQNVTVPAGETATVEEELPAAGISGPVQVSAQSLGLSSVTDSAVSDVSVSVCHDLAIEPVTTAPDAGNRTLVEFSLTNNGTQANNYTLQLDGPDWMDIEPASAALAPGEQTPVYVYMAPDFFGDGTYTATMVAEGEGIRTTVQMNVTSRNGTVSVDLSDTRTPAGAITGSTSGLAAVILTALILLAGGYYIFYRERTTEQEDS